MFDISLEAMQAQLQSKLGRELDAIWQEVIDYRDTKLSDMTYNGKYSAIKKFFKETTAKKFIDCVWKNVGLCVEELKVNSMYNGSFCTWMFFGHGKSQDGTYQIENIVNADYMKKCFPIFEEYLSKKAFSADDLIKLASSFDSTTGAIRATSRDAIRKFLKCEIGFNVELAFLSKDQLAKGSVYTDFTAQEITAIMLHEIGHNLTLVEHAADAYARISSFKYLSAAFKEINSNNIGEAVALANKVADAIDKKGDKANAANIRSTAEKLQRDVATAGVGASPKDMRQSIGGLIETVFGFISDVFVIPFDILLGNMQGNRFGSDQKTKVSDIPLNGRIVTWQERKADEYAVSHGYGPYQVSALRKLGMWFDRFGLSERAIRNLDQAEKLHKDLGFFSKLHLFVLMPLYAGDYSYSLYPAGAKRFREMMNVTIQLLKQYSTDPAYVARYMKDIEYILTQIDSSSTRDEYIAKLYKSYDLFMRYCSLPSFIDWLVHGRVKREIEDLINDVNSIGNNLLTFYGHKLQQLATK